MPSSLCGLQEITFKAINLEHLATCFTIFINHSEGIVYNTDITCCFHIATCYLYWGILTTCISVPKPYNYATITVGFQESD